MTDEPMRMISHILESRTYHYVNISWLERSP